ncbi:hypothetical protein, partial [Sporosarcina sp. E16_8]|uniref:hypothetical protein n=1 Tax=Sporosarcina sp. E16_8 TaxID=2789295 RepID=UPI001A90F897
YNESFINLLRNYRERNAPPYIDHPAQARLRGSRSDKTESGLLSGLSREASTKRRSGISRIFDSFHVLQLLLIAFSCLKKTLLLVVNLIPDNEMRLLT